jgi:hypothetical protein
LGLLLVFIEFQFVIIVIQFVQQQFFQFLIVQFVKFFVK